MGSVNGSYICYGNNEDIEDTNDKDINAINPVKDAYMFQFASNSLCHSNQSLMANQNLISYTDHESLHKLIRHIRECLNCFDTMSEDKVFLRGLKDLCKSSPDDGVTVDLLGKIYCKKNQLKKLVKWYEILYKSDPINAVHQAGYIMFDYYLKLEGILAAKKIAKYLEEGARLNSISAVHMLSFYHNLNRNGFEADGRKIFYYKKKAAKLNSGYSIGSIYALYAHGCKTENFTKANKYYNILQKHRLDNEESSSDPRSSAFRSYDLRYINNLHQNLEYYSDTFLYLTKPYDNEDNLQERITDHKRNFARLTDHIATIQVVAKKN